METKKCPFQGHFVHYKKNGVLGGIRTPDRSLRRRLLYPTELPRQLTYYNKQLFIFQWEMSIRYAKRRLSI